MSEEILAEILRKVQALPRAENIKYRVYKTRFLNSKKNRLEENDAIVAAASKVGIDVGALLTPQLENVSKTVNSDEDMITPAVNTVYEVEVETPQAPFNTAVNTPITVLTDSVFEYGKLLSFPAHDDAIKEEMIPSKPAQSTALTSIQHHASVFSVASPVTTLSLKTPSIRWSIGVSTDKSHANTTQMSIEHRAIAQTAISTIAVAFCTAALIYYGAVAGGKTPESWFWSAFCEISGFALVVAPIAHIGRLLAVRFIGFSLLLLGFLTMHTFIAGDTETKVVSAVQSDSNVTTLEDRVKRLKADLALKQENIEALDAVTFRSKREALTKDTKPIQDEITKAEDNLMKARESLKNGSSAGIASSWGLVEWLRRVALILVNVVAGHAFIGSIGIVFMSMSRRGRV